MTRNKFSCPNCKAVLVNLSPFCPSCGTRLPDFAANAMTNLALQSPQKIRSILVITLGGLILSACIVVGVVILGESASTSKSALAKPTHVLTEAFLDELADNYANGQLAGTYQDIQRISGEIPSQLEAEWVTLRNTVAKDYMEGELSIIFDEADRREQDKIRQARYFWEHNQDSIKKVDGLGTAIEARIVEFVKELPSSQLEDNREGYALLALLDPDNVKYAAKHEFYIKAASAAAKQAKQDIRFEYESILKKYRSHRDEFSETRFYEHPNSPRYLNSRSTIYPYLGRRGDSVYMRLKTTYVADDWLFVESVKFKADDKVFTLLSGSFERDNNSSIWEWRDDAVDINLLTMLGIMAESKTVKLQYNGMHYQKTRTLGPKDHGVIRTMVEDYYRLKDLESKLD